MVIGITGGIASGKSNVCSVIKAHGYTIIDCDEISYKETLRGGKLYKAILKGFGDAILASNGEIDRRALGSIIFNDSSKRDLLNSITHPIILAEVERKIKNSTDKLIFIEVPLLYEAGFDSICDYVICIYLPYELQLKRLMERDNIGIEYARAKIASQMSLDKKRALADFVIESKGSFSETRALTENILKIIERKYI